MSANQKLIEKQTNPRSLTRIAIFYGPYQRKILTDYSINMSTGGVFVETSMVLQEDTELTVKFKLPHTDTIINAKAKVSWINDPLELKDLSYPPGMGLQFLDLSIKDIHDIQMYLDADKFTPTW